MKDFESLRAQLEQTDFPQVYFFKFIVPNKSDNVARVSALFSSDTKVQMKTSSSVSRFFMMMKKNGLMIMHFALSSSVKEHWKL